MGKVYWFEVVHFVLVGQVYAFCGEATWQGIEGGGTNRRLRVPFGRLLTGSSGYVCIVLVGLTSMTMLSSDVIRPDILPVLYKEGLYMSRNSIDGVLVVGQHRYAVVEVFIPVGTERHRLVAYNIVGKFLSIVCGRHCILILHSW